jgi:hypothetical protein
MIGFDSTTALQNEDFTDQVVSSLTLCSSSISLEVQVPNERSMAVMTIPDACALTAHKLNSNRLPFIEDLRIGFPAEMLDAMFLVSNFLMNNSVLNPYTLFSRFAVSSGWCCFLT